MMQMLEAGGVPILMDEVRQADASNPRGYYEYAPVKRLQEDDKPAVIWMQQARGHAVKVVSPLLPHLPMQERYSVLFMRRSLDEIIASQSSMLAQSPQVVHERLRVEYEHHLLNVQRWLAVQRHMQVLDVQYAQLLHNAAMLIPTLVRFLDLALDQEAMQRVIDPNLYRHRR